MFKNKFSNIYFFLSCLKNDKENKAKPNLFWQQSNTFGEKIEFCKNISKSIKSFQQTQKVNKVHFGKNDWGRWNKNATSEYLSVFVLNKPFN